MARFNLLSLAVSFLAISCIVLVQCEDGEPTEEVAAEPAEKAESHPAEEGASEEPESSESGSAETTAPEAGAAREDGNSTSIGEEKRLDSNETMEGREEERADGPKDTWQRWNEMGRESWSTVRCPKLLGNFYEKICIFHCWWNGWQGGRCTSSEVCICLWDGLKLDPDASEKPWVNTPSTKKPNVPTGKPRKDNQIEARDEESDEEVEGISSNTTTLQDTEKAAEVSSVSPSEDSSVSAAETISDVPQEDLAQAPEA